MNNDRFGVDRVPHGGSDELLDFSTNVNPRSPEGAQEVYIEAYSEAKEYPSTYTGFCRSAADYVGCSPESVIPTAGGTQALRLAVRASTPPHGKVAVPYPSFGEYAREVKLQSAQPEFVPYNEVPGLDPSPYNLVILCNPNNPTGETYGAGRLSEYVEECNSVDTTLLVDEAFLDYTERDSLAGLEGVIVVRSLTKMYGLPGLRMGFLVTSGDLLENIGSLRMPWNLSVPAVRVGEYCMQQTSFVEETRERVERERQRMREGLSDSFDVRDSDSPFLLINAGGPECVDEIIRRCKNEGIAVRDARSFRGLNSHIRVAVRLPSENTRLLRVLREE